MSDEKKEWELKISMADLRSVVNDYLDMLEKDYNYTEYSIREDFYWEVFSDHRYDFSKALPFGEDEIGVGSHADEWEFLNLRDDETGERVTTPGTLRYLGNILSAIKYEYERSFFKS